MHPLPLFLVNVASKGLSVATRPLDATLTSSFAGVEYKWLI
jgi:hypothetical protein